MDAARTRDSGRGGIRNDPHLLRYARARRADRVCVNAGVYDVGVTRLVEPPTIGTAPAIAIAPVGAEGVPESERLIAPGRAAATGAARSYFRY